MHLIVINIPEKFRSVDLRNFFSEFIEKEAFNCFHFRHRPQSQLVDLIKCSPLAPPDSGASGSDVRTTDVRCSEDSDTSDGSQRGEGSVSLLPHTETEKQNGGDMTNPQAGFQETAGKENGSIDSETEVEKERNAGDDSRTHWLSSGLAGLASLINEKKKNVKSQTKWSQCEERTRGEKLGMKSPTKGESEKSECGAGKEASKGQYSNNRQGDGKGGSKYDIDSEGEIIGEQPPSLSGEVLSRLLETEAPRRTCCVVDVKNEHEKTFFKRYNHKHWVTREGDILPQRCYLLRVDIWGPSQGKAAANDDYKTRLEHSALSLDLGCPRNPIEFQPPPLMPQGNVGTPTHHFRELIRTCQLPGTLIKKLGLEFSRGRRKRRFGQVPFDYGTSVSECQEETQMQGEGDIAFTAAGHLIPSSADFEKERRRRRRRRRDKGMLHKGPRMELEEEAEDGAEVEEWERYEPFHEDVTSQDRIKERRFEEELEVVWEKGGSGLVFYTDAQFWRAQEGDFDEQTADEWDVDMSVYYGEGSGDKDARDGVEMRTSEKLRVGSLQESVFKRKKDEEKGSSHEAKKGRGKRKIGPTPPPAIGSFEAHTKGIGRRLMESQGWQEGQGLGVGAAGMPYALESDGQHPHERKGFGYHGEKLQGWASTTSVTTRRPQPHRHHRISTVFDRAKDADPSPPPLRTPEPTTLTHRSHPR